MNYKSLFLATGVVTIVIGCAANNDSRESISASATKAEPGIMTEAYKDAIANEVIELEDDFIVSESTSSLPTSVGRQSAPLKHKKAEHQSGNLTHYSQAVSAPLIPGDHRAHYYQDEGREKYAAMTQGSIKQVVETPVSTFSVDVDSGSYTNIRRMLRQGSLPPINAVRVEEMINYFDYAYDAPNDASQPFSIMTELASAPWSGDHVLLKVGLKGYLPHEKERPRSNLVFLLDVSGSMNSPDKLPLLKKSLILLSKQLGEQDSVAIVVYAGASGVVLEPTNGNDTHKIESALNNLSAGGSTNGQAGIELAYNLAQRKFDKNSINRVILATDGDFNVGISDVESLKRLIETKRKEGISLTTLGFGSGNYNDHLMEQLADVGNGNYAYIDNFNEAKKVLSEELQATLMTIAKDVKIQIEFNPQVVKEYRLLGYENRALAREDFNNDKVDAGEIGAGHTVTAIYELALNSSDYTSVDPLRYQHDTPSVQAHNKELAFVKFRYKAPGGDTSQLVSQAINTPDTVASFDQASESFRFSATVAQFGEALRESKYVETDYQAIIENAHKARGDDALGYRSEFIQLVRLAADLSKT